MGACASGQPSRVRAAVAGPQRQGHGSGRQAGMVVEVDSVIARKGSLPVTGRYTCTRQIEQDYEIGGKVLGSGMNGPVKLAKSKGGGRGCAVKSFKKKGLPKSLLRELKNETELYLSLDHPHVARLEMVYETTEALHLVMEYMRGGELYDRLTARTQYTEQKAAETAYQILLAVSYLHAHHIAHRDLKLENFLYQKSDSDHLKLIDFGFAKFYDPSTVMTQSCGSLHYVAPEVLGGSYTTQADMWSVGILTYMLLTGCPLFQGSDDEILRNIRAYRPHFSSRFRKISALGQQFVETLVKRDPAQRLTASSALEHPWIKGRMLAKGAVIDSETLRSLRSYACASHFRRAVLSMMAWCLSTDDIADLREQFLALDTRKQGTISRLELKRILEETFRVESDEAQVLFNSLDTDNDEEIEYTEFLAAALAGRVKAHEDVLRKTFARFDRNETGLVTKQDLRSVLGDAFESTVLEDMIKEADTSEDGKIDYDEFIAYIQKPDSEAGEREPDTVRRDKKRQRTRKVSRAIDRLLEAPAAPGDAASGEPAEAAALAGARDGVARRPPAPRHPSLLGRATHQQQAGAGKSRGVSASMTEFTQL